MKISGTGVIKVQVYPAWGMADPDPGFGPKLIAGTGKQIPVYLVYFSPDHRPP
jgi:hypothetical protein